MSALSGLIKMFWGILEQLCVILAAVIAPIVIIMLFFSCGIIL